MAVPDGKQPISKRRKAVYTLVIVALFCGLLEGGARVALVLMGPGPVPLEVGWSGQPEDAHGLRDLIYEPDERFFFRLRPNLSIKETRNPRIYDLRTNSLGLRSAEVSRVRPPGTFRILCVGDSCTFGSGANMQETYPAHLERQLKERRPDLRCEVLNAGVPGFTSFQGRKYLETEGFALGPDAIVVAFGYNDQCPAHPGPKRGFNKDHPLSDREYAAALRRRHRLGIVRLVARLTADADAPPIDNSAASEPPPPQTIAKKRVSLADYRENLKAIAEQCADAKIKPVILVWPIVGQAIPGNPRGQRSRILYYQQAARDVARKHGAVLVDLVPLVKNRTDLYIDVIHMNTEGYRAVAEAVADALLEHLPAPGPE